MPGQTTPAEMKDLVQRHLPGVPVRSVTALGAGLDHRVYTVDDDLVVRLDRRLDPGQANRLRREQRLLRFLAGRSPIPVPRPLLCVPEAGLLGWGRLPGTPLINLPVVERSALAVPVAAELGTLLAALHALPTSDPPVDEAAVDHVPPLDRLTEAAHLFRDVRAHLRREARDAVQAFLSTPPPVSTSERVMSHNDLGIEHVLVDSRTGRVCGVIDWADAAIVDPARDFGLVLRDLGPRALASALTAYGSHRSPAASLVERATFYARCAALEDLAYGTATGRGAYLEKSHTSLTWLFPVGWTSRMVNFRDD